MLYPEGDSLAVVRAVFGRDKAGTCRTDCHVCVNWLRNYIPRPPSACMNLVEWTINRRGVLEVSLRLQWRDDFGEKASRNHRHHLLRADVVTLNAAAKGSGWEKTLAAVQRIRALYLQIKR